VREGMNREVRRIFARHGLDVNHLRRIKIGKLELGSLGDGQFRFLNEGDIAQLLAGAGEARPRKTARPRADSESKPESRDREEE